MTETSLFSTADLCDLHGEALQVADPVFRDLGGLRCFGGPVHTLRVFEDFGLVKQALERKGDGGVLVVDGGGSLRCALLGDRLATLGINNGWRGVIVNGCVRDTAVLAELAIGIRALNANPTRPAREGAGEAGIEVTFAGVTFRPGSWVCADSDGIVISAAAL